jgi:endonuclease YncB( thermonuclease family)
MASKLSCSAIAVWLLGTPALAAEVTGLSRIVDGDTVEIAQTKIRFVGIDAPETDQLCLDAKAQKWACGISARDELIKHSAGRPWTCGVTGTDKYGRSLGNCSVGGEDVSKWMVRSGWAMSFVQYSHTYDSDEDVARKAHAGLWAGSFVAPWEWRHRGKGTTILGAASVPIVAQKTLLSSVSAGEAPSPECTIKGNVNRSGECIFHEPGGRWYAKINLDISKGKRWFCSVSDAEAAGCRAARN